MPDKLGCQHRADVLYGAADALALIGCPAVSEFTSFMRTC